MVQQTRTTETRPQRIPVGTRNVLTIKEQEPGYVYRMVNDIEDRIEIFKQGGWEVVMGDVKVGDKRVGDSSQVSSAVTKAVGNGITAVLMRIKEEWYNEDIQNQLKRVRRIQSEILEEARARGLTNGNVKVD